MARKDDEKDLEKIRDWLSKAAEVMRLPPAVIIVEAWKPEEDYTAEIDIDDDGYLEITVRINLKKFRSKPPSSQRHVLAHELCHYVQFGLDETLDELYELIPKERMFETERCKKLIVKASERMTDHFAYIALDAVPDWDGI